MKKAIIFLLFTVVFILFLTLNTMAAEKAVYVKDGGTGDGSSPGSALSSLADAFSAMGDGKGTIVVCGKLTQSDHTLNLAKWSNTITITSVHGNTDYRESAGAQLYYEGDYRLILSGPAVFENIKIVFPKTLLIAANYNKLTMGEGIIVEQYDYGHGLYVIGGGQYNCEGEFSTLRDADPHVIIKSGTYWLVSPFSRQIDDHFSGHGRVDIYGGEINGYVFAANVNSGTCGSTEVNVYGGKIAILAAGGLTFNSSVFVKGDSVINVYGGHISVFDVYGVEGKSILNYTEDAQEDIVLIGRYFTQINRVTERSPQTFDMAILLTAAAFTVTFLAVFIHKRRGRIE